jgi:hypothetical protein
LPQQLERLLEISRGRLPYSAEICRMKWRASTGCPRAARAAGDLEGDHVEPEEQVLAEAALRISSPSFLLVAAITRTSTVTDVVPPTGSSFCSCSTRSTLACGLQRHVADLVEEQRAAVGQLELALLGEQRAREGAPRTCRTARSRSAPPGMAAQLTSTNGPSARRLWWWMLRADQLLAGAVLAEDQHAPVRRGGLR